MIAKNVNELEMKQALNELNKRFDNNIEFNRFEKVGNQFHFTLKVIDCRKKGSRYGFSRKKNGDRRKIASACWHVHGFFFEELIKINDNAVIKSSMSTINKNQGNWIDRNIGSRIDPMLYSQACDCSTLK